MRYKVRGSEIRSENTARSAAQASKYLVEWLQNRDFTPSALDYGCGRLRYTAYLAKNSNIIGIVDSEIQLKRKQKIFGEFTSVERYVRKNWPSWIIQKAEDFWNKPARYYHFVLCANVLSSIPCKATRGKSLRAIYEGLLSGGRVLFVNQHTNSSFTRIKKQPSTCTHLDGWIANSRRGSSYYGILTKERVVKLVKKYGFWVEETWIEGQSNYVLVSKGPI